MRARLKTRCGCTQWKDITTLVPRIQVPLAPLTDFETEPLGDHMVMVRTFEFMGFDAVTHAPQYEER